MARLEDDRLLRGLGSFVDDLGEGALHVAFLRSPVANATIREITVAAAGEAEGVHLVLTADDLGDLDKPLPLLADHPQLTAPRTQLPLARRRVRYVGEAIAMVVADSRALAEDALELIDIDYDYLDVRIGLDWADAGGAGIVHEEVEGDLAGVVSQQRGEVEEAFASAPHVVDIDVEVERSCGSPMETRGILAEWDHRRRHLMVWDSTQAPVAIKHGLTRLLGLREDQVDVVAPDVGGGFGTKIMLFYPEEVLVPYASMILGRPVKWTEDRVEHLTSANQERGQIHRASAAFDGEGHILGVRTEFIHDTGAYIPYGVAVAAVTSTHLPGQYNIPNYLARGKIRYTNAPPVSPYRGAGRPQATFVMERLIASIAGVLGLEPIEVRRRNLIQRDQFPFETGLELHDGSQLVYDSGNYQAAVARVEQLLDIPSFRIRQAEARAAGRFLGLGSGTYVEASGLGPFESATATLNLDGSVVVAVGAPSQGQGHQTVFSHIVADVIGVARESVLVTQGDTRANDQGTGTYGSRGAVVVGNAVARAAEDLRVQILEVASNLFECAPEDLTIEGGRVTVIGTPSVSVTLKELAGVRSPVTYVGHQSGVGGTREDARVGYVHKGPPLVGCGIHAPGLWTVGSGVHATIVEVDPSSGIVDIQRYLVVHDCGTILDEKIVNGQVIGGVAQGIGGALLEHLVFDETGQPRTTTFMDFLLPTACDVPRVELEHVETPSPLNPLGVKGVGEAGVIPVSAVIAEAIEDALKPFRVTVTQVPLTQQRILELLANTAIENPSLVSTTAETTIDQDNG